MYLHIVEYWFTVINNYSFFFKKELRERFNIKITLLLNIKQLKTRKEKTAISDP